MDGDRRRGGAGADPHGQPPEEPGRRPPEPRGDLVLEGQGWGGSFTIRDAEGRTVVEAGSAAASAPARGRRGEVVLVHAPEELRLAEIVCVVHIWRLAKKAAVTSSVAASTSIARGV